MKFVISRRAERGFARVGAWIERDDPDRAVSYVGELKDACEGLRTFPERLPWADERRGIRKRNYGSYLILYKVQNDVVRITAVEHASRDLSRLL